MELEYQWAHFDRIDAVLDQEPDDDAYEAVMDALEALILDPINPELSFEHHGTARQPPNRVALVLERV